MDTHPTETESVGYLIEREEKLAAARVAVLVDRRHATDKESLRWDVLPVSIPGAVLHAKLAVLCWSDFVRVIISSANLTENAYRKNVEVCGALELRRDGGAAKAVRACLDFLGEVMDRASGREDRQGPRRRTREGLALVRSRIRGWPDRVSDRDAAVPVFSGLRRPVLPQLQGLWSSTGPPRWACVVAPFFQPAPGDRLVARALVETLAKRGSREVYVDVPCDDQPDGQTRVYASKGMVDELAESCKVKVRRVKSEQGGETRPLHAKQIWLENDSDRLVMIGSSNFTVPGLGLNDKHANLEANLVYRTRDGDEAYGAMDSVWPDVEDDSLNLDDSRLVWAPVGGEDGEIDGACPLPAAFEEALYAPGPPATIQITLGRNLPTAWSIAVASGPTLLTSDADVTRGEHAQPWLERTPPFVLEVRWTTREGLAAVAAWPVNVEDPASLPPPDALRDLSLDELVAVLGSTRPLPQAVIEVLKKRTRTAPPIDAIVNPLERFDSDATLLRRTKRVALALDRLRERLERPVLTSEALDWRLRGPIGPDALAQAFVKEAMLPGEEAFLLAELALSLKRVDPRRAAEGGLDQAIIAAEIGSCIRRLKARAEAQAPAAIAPGMARYTEAAFKEALK
jgi:hypothetical protein